MGQTTSTASFQDVVECRELGTGERHAEKIAD